MKLDWKLIGTMALVAVAVVAVVFYVGPVKRIVAPATPSV